MQKWFSSTYLVNNNHNSKYSQLTCWKPLEVKHWEIYRKFLCPSYNSTSHDINRKHDCYYIVLLHCNVTQFFLYVISLIKAFTFELANFKILLVFLMESGRLTRSVRLTHWLFVIFCIEQQQLQNTGCMTFFNLYLGQGETETQYLECSGFTKL